MDPEPALAQAQDLTEIEAEFRRAAIAELAQRGIGGDRAQGASSGTAAEGGPDSFFPNLDVSARSVLAAIGGGEDILVVPDAVEMQRGNPAITVKGGQVDNYRETVREEARKHNLDVEATAARVKEDTILVKESLLLGDDLSKQATIWHEWGHVLFGAPETGDVFTHELQAVKNQLGQGVAQTWVKTNRTMAYLARYVSDPGVAAMTAELGLILSPEDFVEFQRLRQNVIDKVRVEPKEQVVAPANPVGVGQRFEGTVNELKERLTQPDAAVEGSLTIGQTVSLGTFTWKIENVFPDEDADFTIYKWLRLT